MNMIREQIADDLDLLGRMQNDAVDNLLLTADFCRIFTLVNKMVIKVQLVRQKVKQRRDAILRENKVEYKKRVIKVNDLESEITNQVKQLVCSNYQMSEETFSANLDKLLSDPDMFQQYKLQISQIKVQ